MNTHQPPAIGLNIKICRKQKSMSMDELSKRSGVSKSMLSQIEQEKTNPTVTTVWKISRALDVSVEELLETNTKYQIEVLKKENAPVIYSEDKTCIFRVNSPIHMTDNLELYHLTVMPNGKLISMPHFPNAEEFLTIIKGQLRVTSGSDTSILNTGDTARYRVDQKHSIENLTEKEVEAFLVVWFPK